jgi:hypothetical protein
MLDGEEMETERKMVARSRSQSFRQATANHRRDSCTTSFSTTTRLLLGLLGLARVRLSFANRDVDPHLVMRNDRVSKSGGPIFATALEMKGGAQGIDLSV